MVSTRGGTRTAGADESTLRKKPVRKTTAKAAPAATKAKTTRSKKAEPEPEQPQDEEEDEIQVAEPASKATRRAPAAKPEPTKRAVARPKKDVEPPKAVASKPAIKTTKPAPSTTRTTKAKTTKVEKPDLLPPAPTKTTGTRATRGTRATAAKEKTAPLSPKKITQVSRAPPRTMRTASKPKAPVTQGRPATRKRRNVSDENADLLVQKAAEADLEDEDVVQSKNTKTSKKKTPEAPVPKTLLIEDEDPASSRPTTPPDGIGERFEESEDELAEANEGEEDEENEEDSDEGDYTNNTSHDELCGPKTPMKRSSPRFGTQKGSRALDLGVPSKTPVRRFAVLGTQLSTPQTTKPYCKPGNPQSEIRPTTVARARDRAMVFPKLQPFTVEADESEEDHTDSVEDEGTPVPVDLELDNIDMDTTIEDLTAGDEQEPIFIQDSSDKSEDSVEVDDVVMQEDSEELLSQHEEDAGQIVDPEEKIVMHEDKQECGPVPAIETSFDSNDSVIVTRPTIAPEDEFEDDMQVQMEEMPTSTPKPETLVWENIREDVTIPFNFDADMSLSRSLPEVEHNDRLSIANAFDSAFQDEADAVAGAQEERELSEDAPSMEETDGMVKTPEQSTGVGRESLDATVNLSDFIDVKSLSESRRQSKLHDEAAPNEIAQDSDEDIHRVQTESSPSRPAVPSVQDTFEDDVAVDDTPDETHAAPEHTKFLNIPTTPARDVSELDIALSDLQQQPAPNMPRYALPTISSRRKSLPAKLYPGTLRKECVRPNTSDGNGIASIATPSRASLRSRMALLSRPTTAHGLRSTPKTKNQSWTPRVNKTPMARTPGTSVPLGWQTAVKNGTPFAKTPVSRTLFARTPGTSVPEISSQAVKERFPGLPSRDAYNVDTAVASPFKEADSYVPPKERFPAMPPRDNYDSTLQTPRNTSTPMSNAATAVKSASKERFPGLPAKDTYEELAETPGQEETEKLATPQAPDDRFPGLPYRRTYEEHAKTAIPASRFRTPSHSPAKRPATVQKQASLRKVALKASTPTVSRTPMKTSLKAPALTPGQVPMTPHPAAPLRGVVALVEVYTSDGDCATPAFVALLQRLGAKTTKTFSERLTHVVYKEGSPNTLQRLRIHNKHVMENGTGKEIHCVNSRWVSDCDAQGTRMPESDEAYAVELDDVPRTAKRRRKSMEPMSLTNIRGSVFRDRKSSLGRSSLGRAPLKMDSPAAEDTTPINQEEDKENSGEDGSPATPAYLAAPNTLVQQTAPLNKVRKLDFKSQQAAKNRRLTFWNGGA